MNKLLYLMLLLVLTSCGIEKETSTTESITAVDASLDTSTADWAFFEVLKHANNKDYRNFNKLVYEPVYTDRHIERLNVLSRDEANNYKSSILRKYQGLDAVISSKELKDDLAILTVSVIKSNQTKEDKIIHMIKVDGDWLLKTFGFNHLANFEDSDKTSCSESCSSNSWFDENTNSCYCWEELEVDTKGIAFKGCDDKEVKFQNSCYSNYAENSLNEKYCLKVSSQYRKSCYEKVAEKAKDISICAYLWDDAKCFNVAE